jgi:phosphoesterase RecJ-like protein
VFLYDPAMSDAFDAVQQALTASRRVLVTTHVKPDGDALGSTAAMVQGLTAKGIVCHVLLFSRVPEKYAFVYADPRVNYSVFDKEWPADVDLASFDTLLVVDTGTWSQLPGLKEKLVGWSGKKIVVDHHLTQEDWAELKLVDTAVGAAGEIVAELLARWDVPLTKPLATAILLAIVSDTGWFQYSSTRPVTLRLGARLMEAGVDFDQLYQRLYQNERPQRLLVQARAMQTLQLLCDGRLAVMRVPTGVYAETGATSEDTEGMINVPLAVRTVEVSILLTNPPTPPGGPIRVSTRSKGKVDVAKFAQQFGGGGHARAAGLKIDNSTLDAAAELVIARMTEVLQGTAGNKTTM